MYVPLTANWLTAKPSACVYNNAKEQHSLLELGEIVRPPYVHGDGVDRIRSAAVRIAKAGSNVVEVAILGSWPKQVGPVFEMTSCLRQIGLEIRDRSGSRFALVATSGMSIFAPDKKCFAVDLKKACAETELSNHLVIVPGIARPAGKQSKRYCAGVRYPVGDTWGNEV